jgi:hypothetical protein
VSRGECSVEYLREFSAQGSSSRISTAEFC